MPNTLFLLLIFQRLTMKFSILFVHGLQGHPRNTWTWESDRPLPIISTPVDCKPKNKEHKFSLNRFKKKDHSPKAPVHEKRSAVFWPYHLLPTECPESRILTWGYDSYVSTFFHGSTNKNDMFSHSRDLLNDLNRERRTCVNTISKP